MVGANVVKIKTKETELNRQKTYKENREKKQREKEQLIKTIQEESKELLLPTLQSKSVELSNKIVELLDKRGKDNVNNTQILSMIARKSVSEIAMATYQISYTPQEIMIGFDLYLEMIYKINEIKSFPPSPESFSLFMGVTYDTYKLWLVDPEKKNVMEYINSYMLSVLSSGGLTGELREISSMFQQKVLGKVEQQVPVQHEVTVKTDVSDINKQLEALKRENIIEAEWEEENE